ncbi:hypothetical protein [Amycolatopsis sp. lyj-23]|uniref:hypothetical protein n=1 Tax=Amycolatopsis sp. lyj-23 TaxID=2789283 RepID=UPI00397E05C0
MSLRESAVVLAQLTVSERDAMRVRAAHLREVMTGFRAGAAEQAKPAEPRPEYAHQVPSIGAVIVTQVVVIAGRIPPSRPAARSVADHRAGERPAEPGASLVAQRAFRLVRDRGTTP